jgi:DNA-binding protein H-NS
LDTNCGGPVRGLAGRGTRLPQRLGAPLFSVGTANERLQAMKWEYTKIALNETRRREDPLDVLLEAGKSGWELVTLTTNHVAYFKRLIQDTSQPDELRPVQPEQQSEQPSAASPASAASGDNHAKYQDPVTGDTWSGRGRMPNWLKRKLDGGDGLEKYLSG